MNKTNSKSFQKYQQPRICHILMVEFRIKKHPYSFLARFADHNSENSVKICSAIFIQTSIFIYINTYLPLFEL